MKKTILKPTSLLAIIFCLFSVKALAQTKLTKENVISEDQKFWFSQTEFINRVIDCILCGKKIKRTFLNNKEYTNECPVKPKGSYTDYKYVGRTDLSHSHDLLTVEIWDPFDVDINFFISTPL